MNPSLVPQGDRFMCTTLRKVQNLCTPQGIIERIKKPRDEGEYMAAIHASSENFEQIASTHEIVVVDFWATWCGPCRAFGPVFEKVSDKYPDIPFVKVDVDECATIAEAAQIQAVPTLMVIKRGEVIYRQAGSLLASDLEDLVEQAQAYEPSEDSENN